MPPRSSLPPRAGAAQTPPRPVVLWDDHCSFCARSVRLLRFLDIHNRLEYQGAGREPLEEMKLIESGRITGGYDAIVRISRHLPFGIIVAPILGLPPLRALGRRVYRWVAAHRTCRI